MSAVGIRAADPVTDAAILAALHAEALPDEPWDEAAMAEVLAMPGAAGWLAAASDGAPIGFLIALDTGEVAEILALGVRAAAQRQGVATALIREFRSALTRRGVGAILLEVAEDNRPARALYARLGFTAAGRRPGYYRRRIGPPVDALLLRRPVAG